MNKYITKQFLAILRLCLLQLKRFQPIKYNLKPVSSHKFFLHPSWRILKQILIWKELPWPLGKLKSVSLGPPELDVSESKGEGGKEGKRKGNPFKK